jgi:hypothetical protein
MGVGIEVYNADGSLQFDIGTRVFRALVVDFTTGGSAGSITVDNSIGTIVPQVNVDGQEGTSNDGPVNEITVNGGTVSWGSGSGQSGSILVY